MTNITDHQYAGDARIPFGFGGSGQGRILIKTAWAAENLTVNSQQVVFKALKECFVSNFALHSTDMDTHVTPTLEFDVGQAGSVDDDDEFISGSAATIGEAGGLELTNVLDESTEAGTRLAAGDTIIISVRTAAATAAAGTTYLSFDCTTVTED